MKREVEISKGLRGKRGKGKTSDDLDEKDVDMATLKASRKTNSSSVNEPQVRCNQEGAKECAIKDDILKKSNDEEIVTEKAQTNSGILAQKTDGILEVAKN